MKEKTKAKILTENSTYLYGASIITEIFSFIVSILVIRKLSVEVFGTYNLLIASFIVFRVFGISTFASVYNRYIPELVAQKNFVALRQFIFYIFFFSFLILALLVTLVLIFQHPFAEFFKITDFNTYIYAFFYYITMSYIRSIAESLLTSLLLHRSLSIFKITRSVLSPVIYLYYLPVLDVNIMLLIEGSFTLFIILPSIFTTIRYLHNNLKLYPAKNLLDTDIRKRILRYGLFSSLDQLGLGIVGRTSDYFIISAIGDPIRVGLYSFAYKLFSMVDRIFPINDFLTIVRPLFFQKYSQDYKKEDFNQMFNFMVKMLLPIYILPFIYLAVFGKAVITYVYDPKYIESYWVAVVIFFSAILTSFIAPVSLIIKLHERVEILLYTNIIVVFSIVGGIFFMKWWGIVGVAVATTIGSVARKLMMFLLIRRKVPVHYRVREFVNYIYITLIPVAVFLFPEMFVTNIYLLAVLSVLFVAVFLLVFIMLHPFNTQDLALLNKISSSSKLFNKITPVLIKIHGFRTLFSVHKA